MSLRRYLQRLQEENLLKLSSKAISKKYEIAGVLKKMEPAPILFDQVVESSYKVFGNLFCSKADFARYFNIAPNQIIPRLIQAVEQHSPCEVVESAPCQECVDLHPDLDCLPVLRHCEQDGGNYISSGVFVTRHPEYGQNLDFHRCMQYSKTEMAVRVVLNRHFDRFLRDQKQLDVAICIGNPPNILAAAATSVALGIDELEIANALEPVQVVRAKTVDLFVPAEAEFVLEGSVYLDKTHAEGPFVDLTETYDVVRQEPVFVLKAITHREDPLWHALLPGGLEHKLLMGMPREPTIYQKVNEVVRCLDVNVNPGGCSWLHAVVQIDKQDEQDGRKAIQAAFAGHTSCKHVFVVDKDIDIYNPLEVEWAIATRFQADRDLVIKDKEPGSSLDPSSDPGTHLTTKAGFDLTKPLVTQGKSFDKAAFPDVELSKFLTD
ncbi:MAG: UbiD family decarboxylase [Omnitrophica WOR_2 bacterium]